MKVVKEDVLEDRFKPERGKIDSILLFTNGHDFGINHRPLSPDHVMNIKKNLFTNDLSDKIPVVMWFSEFEHYKVVEGQHAVEAKPKKSWLCNVVEGDGSTDKTLRDLAFDYSARESQTVEPSRYALECNTCHILHERFRHKQESKGNKSMKGVTSAIQLVMTNLNGDTIKNRLRFYTKMESEGVLDECCMKNLTMKQAQEYMDEKGKERLDKETDYGFDPSYDDDSSRYYKNKRSDEMSDEELKKNTYEIDPGEAHIKITKNEWTDMKIDLQSKDYDLKSEKEKNRDLVANVDSLVKAIENIQIEIEELKVEIDGLKSDKTRIKKKYNQQRRKVKKLESNSKTSILAVDEVDDT